MNSAAQGVAVALKGRVPCFVVGPVSKGDLLVTSHVPGVAQVSDTWIGGAVIGKAIEDCPIDGEVRIIEIAIGSI
jgi:butyrate kinase